MSEQDVENTDQVTDDGEVQPEATEGDGTQDEQQETSSEEQVTEVTDPAAQEASEESDGPGEGESTEETEPDEMSEDSGSGTSDDTLLLSGENDPHDSDESGDFTISPDDDGSDAITVGDGSRTGDGESSGSEFSFDSDPSDDNVISFGTTDDDSSEDETEPVESVEEPEQEPVAVDAGPEDDATPVDVVGGPPPEDSAEDIIYPEPTPEPDDGPGDDADGGKSPPVYEVQVDPRIAAIQAQVDITHLVKDDEDDEEEELQVVVADSKVERPIVEDQPAPGTGPIPPQPGQADNLDVFDLKPAGDADASPPAIVTPDLKTAGDADGTEPEAPRLASDITLRFDLDDAKDGDSKETDETTTKFEFEDADAFVDRGVTFDLEPITTAHDVTSAPMLKGSLFPVDDDEDDDEPEDDAVDDF